MRVVSLHRIDERQSVFLEGFTKLDRRSFARPMHPPRAHDLTETLVKDMFGRAMESRKVELLKKMFKEHLGLEIKFVRSEKTKGWNKVSLYDYECWLFSEPGFN